MENLLFRKSSIERITSPEELHDYMRVTGPKMWMLLVMITVLLIGFIIFASTTTLENVMPVKVTVRHIETPTELQEEGEPSVYIFVEGTLPIQMMDTVKVGMKVRIGDKTGTIDYVSTSLDTDNSAPEHFIFYVDMKAAYLLEAGGEYDAEIILEAATPISFLLGGE